MTQQATPGWYPDPSGSGQQRYFDGRQWTEHLHPGGQQQAGQQPQQQAPVQQQAPPQQPPQQRQGADLEQAAELSLGYDKTSDVQAQVARKAGGPAGQGGGTIFTEPILVVNQKAKLIEVNNEYAVFDQNGRQIAAVMQVGQSALQKAARFLTKYDNLMTHKLEIRDPHGQPMLRVTRPAAMFKSTVHVERGDGMQLGEIVQQNMIGKINFAINVNGQQIGAIQGENWRAWDFAIVDHAGNRVASVNKSWGGLKSVFTTSDNYVLSLHGPLQDPMLSMTVAAALTIDTALHQRQ